MFYSKSTMTENVPTNQMTREICFDSCLTITDNVWACNSEGKSLVPNATTMIGRENGSLSPQC